MTPTIVDPKALVPPMSQELQDHLNQNPTGGKTDERKTGVLIVDDVAATRENINKLMEFHPQIEAVGQAEAAKRQWRKRKNCALTSF